MLVSRNLYLESVTDNMSRVNERSQAGNPRVPRKKVVRFSYILIVLTAVPERTAADNICMSLL